MLASDVSQSSQFQAGSSGSVAQMLIAMGHVTGTPQVTMRLYADNSDTLGSQIDSYYVTTVNTGSFGAGTEVITRDVSDAGWTVTAVQNYWLMAQSATDTWLAWNFSTDDGVYGRAVINNSGSPGYFDGVGLAIRLEAVPEPASMIALGAGLLAVARRRRKAKANHSDSRLPELTRVQGVFRL
ncbi:MAG TPA: hypothetical protein DCY02_03525 [Armatimonadetes bacterium]|nr:hypothetical protein [Armatimonadota bacterium]HCM73999.1 hypothetical protein [Armatimonadota bacterium]